MDRLKHISHLHLIGIGGSGLSAIARVLHQQGFQVTGSDREMSPLAKALISEGIQVFEGHKAENIKNAELVVRSSAIKDENVEVQAALQKGIPVLKRSEFLRELLDDKKVIAVAGTHGKTTTTALLAWVLSVLGTDPSYIIGGVARNLGTNARAGSGEFFVIEADEYDRMFLGIQPYLAVITNIEHDHPDCYPTEEEFYRAFIDFVKGVAKGGIVILCSDDRNVLRLYDEVKNQPLSFLFYGRPEGTTFKDNRYWFSGCDKKQTDHNCYQVNYQKKPIAEMSLQIHGDHNVLNATAVVAAAHQLGLHMKEVEQALKEFQGSGRRLEIKGIFHGIIFIDDYAHHPTEIKTTIRAARKQFPQKALWVVWQPHTYSRVKTYCSEFIASFGGADRVFVMDVYAARETQPAGFDLEAILIDLQSNTSAKVIYTPSIENVVSFLTEELTDNTAVLVLSAGNANEIIPQTLKSLEEKNLAKNTKAAFEQQRFLKEELLRLFGGKVKFNEPLWHYTTIQVGGNADIFIEADSRLDLIKGAAFAWVNQLPLTLLGSGSNVLISDQGIRGVVILNRANRVEIFHHGESAWVWAESGANFSGIARSAGKQGLTGLEWAIGIPGTLGGAVVGNAGAHGSDVSSTLIVAEILQQKAIKDVIFRIPEKDEEILASLSEYWLSNRMEYEYRSSRFKQDKQLGLVLSARMRLQPDDKVEIQKRMEEYLTRRKKAQPAAPNMGSVFKNPPNDYAGRLIEECGLKGKSIGGAMVSQQHANFFINTGGATSSDFWELICFVKDAVQKQHNITLDLEVERLGEWS